VVDADTNQPIDGAVILTVFYLWPSRGILNLPTPKMFRGSGEAVTGTDGRFEIEGPFDKGSWWSEELHVYKPGYGPWRFRFDQAASTQSFEERNRAKQEMWERLTTTGVVIEMRPLRTRDERIKFSDFTWSYDDIWGWAKEGWDLTKMSPFGPYYLFDVPDDLLRSLQAAVDIERQALGLPVRKLDGRRQPR